MPDSKITALTSISTSTDPANDPLVIVDVSDTSMAATGTTKKVTLNQLLGASGTATLASATITGDLTVRTNKLQVTSTGVGIGGASAAYPLEINGGASASTSQFKSSSASVITRFTDGTGETGYVGSGVGLISGISRTDFGIASNGALVFGVSTGLAMTLNATGLGIGTASPATKLHIDTLSAGYGLTLAASSLTGRRFQFGINSDANLAIYDTSAAAVRMIIDGSGNCGIGVTPSAWGAGLKALQVNGGASLAGDLANSYLNANAFYNGTSWIYSTTNGASRMALTTSGLQWYIAPSGTAGTAIGSGFSTAAMTLDASGRLLVGSTSNPAYDGFRGFFYNNGNNTLISQCDSANYCLLLYTGNGTNAGSAAAFKYGATTVGTIQTTASSTAYNTSSDYRLKESVQPMAGALNRIAALKPSTYKWKVDGSSGEGFIAHELAQVVPLAVTGEKDAVNDDGSIKPQGVDLSKVVPVLVAAIQELAARVQTLETR